MAYRGEPWPRVRQRSSGVYTPQVKPARNRMRGGNFSALHDAVFASPPPGLAMRSKDTTLPDEGGHPPPLQGCSHGPSLQLVSGHWRRMLACPGCRARYGQCRAAVSSRPIGSSWDHGQGTRTLSAKVLPGSGECSRQAARPQPSTKSCAGAGLLWRALEVLQSASRGSHVDQDIAWDIYHRLASGEYHITSVSALQAKAAASQLPRSNRPADSALRQYTGCSGLPQS